MVPEGRITLNAAACRVLMAADIKTVVVLWDKTDNKMAIKAAQEGERNSFAISFTGESHSGSLTVKSFFQHIGWHATDRQALPTTWNASEKMFEVTLPAKYLGAEEKTPQKKRIL